MIFPRRVEKIDATGDVVFPYIYNRELYESMSLNDDVLKWSDIVIKEIIDANKKELGAAVERGNERTINKTIEIEGLPFKLIVYNTFHLFCDESDFRHLGNKYEYGDEIAPLNKDTFDKFQMTLISPVISGKLSSNLFADPVCHEIDHIFEIITTGRELLKGNKHDEHVYDNLYMMTKKPGYTEEEKEAARCCYVTYWFENHAFTHGLYKNLSFLYTAQRTDATIYYLFKMTDQYEDLQLMKKIIDNYDEYAPYICLAMKRQKDDVVFANRFRKRLNYNFKRFSKACGKVLYTISMEHHLGNDMPYKKFGAEFAFTELD